MKIALTPAQANWLNLKVMLYIFSVAGVLMTVYMPEFTDWLKQAQLDAVRFDPASSAPLKYAILTVMDSIKMPYAVFSWLALAILTAFHLTKL